MLDTEKNIQSTVQTGCREAPTVNSGRGKLPGAGLRTWHVEAAHLSV